MNSQEICHLKCNVAAFTVNCSERRSLTCPTSRTACIEPVSHAWELPLPYRPFT